VRFLDVKKPIRAKGVEFQFHVTTPEPSDTSPGARVPSRQLSRYLSASLLSVAVTRQANGSAKSEPMLLELLRDVEGRSLKGPEIPAAFPELREFVDEAAKVALETAKAQLEKLKAEARETIEDERDMSMLRIKLSLTHQGVPAARIEAVLGDELAFSDSLLAALDRTTVQLDSACAYVINR
jgi:ATP-dependent helicase HepA